MDIKVLAEGEVLREAYQVLLQHLSPSKVARFWANWQVGHGDYLRWRDEHFRDETVTTLYEKIKAYQERR
ncbi:MAG: hypothetical protein GXP39_02395 [Chloroflexi bacterium]|nr:hypothetical protein [Chloroflexota bacterium]